MLRRNSTKSKSDLHRRKSTSSVRSVQLEHIDATDAQRDAHIAAAQAFARGRDRSSEAEMQKFPAQQSPPRREQCGSNRLSRNDSVTSRGGNESGQGVKRRQSVRFVRPQSSQGGTSRQGGSGEAEGSKTQRSIYTPSMTQTSRLLRGKVLQSSENLRIPVRGSSCSDTRPSTATSHNRHLETLAKADMLYTPEDDLASMPSSYRRLRKTRSMFTPANTTPLIANAGTSRGQRETFLSVVSPNGVQGIPYSCSVGYNPGSSRKENVPLSFATPILKAPKSMSFLRNRRERLGPLDSRNTRAPSIQPCKTDLEISSQRSRLNSKHSMFFMPKSKRIEPGMKKTMRNSSSGSPLPTAVTSASLPPIRDGTLKKKARKVSSSLKSKIKTLFSLHKGEDNPTQIPDQQIEAQKSHVSRVFDGRYYGKSSSTNSVYRDGASLSRVPSHVPTLRAVPQSGLLHFRQGSVESIETEVRKVSEDRSRVTSWTNSDTESRTTQQPHPPGEESERPRLSVIREVGAYAPSSTPRGSSDQEQLSKYQGDLPSTIADQPDTSTPIVHSDRVYSALMKRANETKQLADIVEQQRKSTGGTSDPFRTMSPNTSASESCSDRSGPATTHRFSTTGEVRRVSVEHGVTTQSTKKEHLSKTEHVPSPSLPSPTIRVVPQIKEPHLGPTTLSHRSSAFFGSPECHFFRTKSPYRRALQETISSESHDSIRGNPVEAPGVSQHPLRNTTTSGSDVDGQPVYSESIYSEHHTDEREVIAHNASPLQDQPQSSSILGDASVFVDVPTYCPTGSLGQNHPTGPIDWKAWLSANASRLEPQSSPAHSQGSRRTGIEYVLPSMPNYLGRGSGHVRELAQIDDQENDDFDIAVPSTRPVKMLDSPFGNSEPNVVKLSPRYRTGLKTTPMSSSLQQENALPSSGELQKQSPSAPSMPSVPSKSPLRPLPAQNLKSTKSARDLGALKSDLPHTPEQATSVATRRTKSLARLRSLNRIRTTDHGSPYMPDSASGKFLRGTGSTESAKTGVISESMTSSPLLSAAVLRQFGPTSPRKSLDAEGPDARRVVECGSNDADDLEADAMTPEAGREAEVTGSKQMVESFLSSRRRRMTSEDESLAFV